MSEVIVRMEMPKRCCECDLADGVVCMATGGVFGREVPKMTWIKTRPSWCPIVGELPEQHGDLIDRDETFHAAQPEECPDELWAKTTCGRVVLEAKTVIAATRAKMSINEPMKAKTVSHTAHIHGLIDIARIAIQFLHGNEKKCHTCRQAITYKVGKHGKERT